MVTSEHHFDVQVDSDQDQSIPNLLQTDHFVAPAEDMVSLDDTNEIITPDIVINVTEDVADGVEIEVVRDETTDESASGSNEADVSKIPGNLYLACDF